MATGTGERRDPPETAGNPSPLRASDWEAYRAFAADRNRLLRERLARRLGAAPLADALFEELGHEGKHLRPALTLASFSVFSGGLPPSAECLAAAHALEVFHAFVLVHDDVIDRSDQRRGRPTFHRRLEERPGVPPETASHLAVVLGDILFGFAIGLLGEPGLEPTLVAPLQRFLAGVTEDTGLGESLELTHLHEPLSAVGRDRIEEVYYLKTTRYTIEAPLWLGGRAAGADPDDLGPLADFARPIGLGFQMENDLHEAALPRDKFAARAYDFRTGVKTLFLRALHDSLDAQGRADLDRLLARCASDPRALGELHSLIHATGALESFRQETEASFASAGDWIPASPYAAETKEGLRKLADFVFARRKHSEAE